MDLVGNDLGQPGNTALNNMPHETMKREIMVLLLCYTIFRNSNVILIFLLLNIPHRSYTDCATYRIRLRGV